MKINDYQTEKRHKQFWHKQCQYITTLAAATLMISLTLHQFTTHKLAQRTTIISYTTIYLINTLIGWKTHQLNNTKFTRLQKTIIITFAILTTGYLTTLWIKA